MTVTVYAKGLTVAVLDNALPPPPPPPPPPSPPPPVVGLTDPAITDAPGGLTAQKVYGGNAANASPMAPWLNWIGQDNTVVASVRVGTGFVGAFSLDLSKVCVKDAPVQIGLPAGTGTLVTVAARASATPPRLDVVYDDGSKDTLALVAEVEADTSTSYMLMNQPTLEISGKGTPWFRFAAPKRAVASASLTITAVKAWQGGAVNVVKFTAGYLPQPATLATWGGTTIMQTECWEDGPAYTKDRIILPAYDMYAQRSFVDDPAGRCLQLMYDPRQSNLLDLKVGIWPEATEAWMSYDLKIMPGAGLATLENGKLPGFSTATKPDDAYVNSYYKLPFPLGTIGTLGAGNGGSMVHGNDGWSDRGDWLAPRHPPHPLAGKWPLSSYVYNPDFVDYNGEQMEWGDYGTGTIDEGTWNHIEHRLKVNSVPTTGKGNNDGEIESRINGKLALLRTNLRLRDAGPYTPTTMYGVPTDLAIRSFWLCAYHGGHAFPTARVPAFRMRNFKVVRVS